MLSSRKTNNHIAKLNFCSSFHGLCLGFVMTISIEKLHSNLVERRLTRRMHESGVTNYKNAQFFHYGHFYACKRQ
jgi:hypothetical protein